LTPQTNNRWGDRPVARRSNNARRGNLFVSVFIPRFFLVEMLLSSMLIALYSLFRRDFGVIRLVDAVDRLRVCHR